MNLKALERRPYSPGSGIATDPVAMTNIRMQKFLIIAGLSLLVAGFLWPWLGKLPLGRLPGDILVERASFRLYIPVTTAVLLSLVATLFFWLFRR